MPKTLVDLAKLLCPRPAAFAGDIDLALRDPARYVAKHAKELDLRGIDAPVKNLAVLALIDGLIARKLATELDWREEPEDCIEQIFALRSLPAQTALKKLDAPEVDDEMTTARALKIAAGALAPAGLVLATIDIRSDSYPALVLDAKAFPKVEKLAAACEVLLKVVPPAKVPKPRPRTAKPSGPAEKVARYLADIDARRGREAKAALAYREKRLAKDLEKGARGDSLRASTSLAGGSDWITWRIVHGKGDPWYDVDRFEAHETLRLACDLPGRRLESLKEGQLFNAIFTRETPRLERLVEVAHGNRAGTKYDWARDAPNHPGKAFAVWLAARLLGKRVEIAPFGPFADLAKTWKKAADLRPIADWHLGNIGKDVVGLHHYDLIPVDLAAIRKVRDVEGLATIWPDDHPLVTNPVAQAWLSRPKRTWSAKKDALYTSIIRTMKKNGELPAWFDPNKP